MDSYLNKSTWEVNENANTSYSLSGLHLFTFEEETEKYVLQKYYKGSIERVS